LNSTPNAPSPLGPLKDEPKEEEESDESSDED